MVGAKPPPNGVVAPKSVEELAEAGAPKAVVPNVVVVVAVKRNIFFKNVI